jgi:hypothetical protein
MIQARAAESKAGGHDDMLSLADNSEPRLLKRFDRI